jgi:hypothetical protein
MQPTDAILFSANPNRTEIDDAIRHLADHEELYWSVGFQIDIKQFSYPMYGYIHIAGEQVEYRATINEIIPFSPEHFDPRLKPEAWIREQKERPRSWKYSLVITEIVPFSYETCELQKRDGGLVQRGPEGYVRILPPDIQRSPESLPAGKSRGFRSATTGSRRARPASG